MSQSYREVFAMRKIAIFGGMIVLVGLFSCSENKRPETEADKVENCRLLIPTGNSIASWSPDGTKIVTSGTWTEIEIADEDTERVYRKDIMVYPIDGSKVINLTGSLTTLKGNNLKAEINKLKLEDKKLQAEINDLKNAKKEELLKSKEQRLNIVKEELEKKERAYTFEIFDGWETHPTWSPDGTMIAFAAVWNDHDEKKDNDSDLDIWLIHLSDTQPLRVVGQPIQLTRDLGNESFPTWSPDGTKLSFLSDKGGIWMLDIP